MRKSVLVFTAGAIVCAAVAGVIRFKLVPDAERVQSDQNTVTRYAGTASYLNQQAVAGGDLANAFVKNAPFTAVETVKAIGMHGNVAVLSDVTAISGAGGVLGNPTSTWAVDRKTLMPAAAPAGVTADAHQGLAVGFAFSPDKHDYPWWDGATGTQATAKYVRSESHVGRSTYVFTVDASGAEKDPATLAQLPPAVPVSVLKGLAATMAPAMQGALAALLPPGGDSVMVPLSYTSSTTTTMWVDQLSGTTVDADAHQTVTAQMKTKLGTVPLTAVLDVDTKMSPAGIADAVKQSKDDQSKLLWEGAVAPLALVVLALALIVGAVLAGRRPRTADSAGTASGAAVGPTGGTGPTDAGTASNAGNANDAGDAEPEAFEPTAEDE
ncbi:porin PorA family protein [Catenulispora pinisilvae]|uniref:porin PorA family protein n=1 Tax=Catenulispora pinisilvae TaxID=2705253 RepID=UPI00189213E4|nr:porin PorA family protein [Catenulispora pinisilvae]